MDKTYFGVNIGEYLLNITNDKIYTIIGLHDPYHLKIESIDIDKNKELIYICISKCCYDEKNQCGIKPHSSTSDYIGFKTIKQINKHRIFK